MYDSILHIMQQSIQAGNYIMTVHAEEEMNDDGLTIYDVEAAIMSGTIVGRQRDARSGEWKYIISGTSTTGIAMDVVAKLRPTDLVVIITMYIL